MKILALNPGSTSTRVTVFLDGRAVLEAETSHPKSELLARPRVMDQEDLRLAAIRRALDETDEAAGPYDAVVGRGGLLAPLPGGTYAIDEPMLADLRASRYGEHPCNLGAVLALALARESGCPAFVVDPPVTDELDDVVRVTGLPEIRRRSVFHALSQRGAARRAARELGLRYGDHGFIVAHLGGGVSIGAHRKGRVVDVINGLDGEGPFTPERSGGLPLLSLLSFMEREGVSPAEMRRRLVTGAGLWAHLGTNDLRQVEAGLKAGEAGFAEVFAALAHNIAKHAASLAPVFVREDGGLDLTAVVLTGGMARSARLVKALRAGLAFLGPVLAVTGLEEMEVLAEGAALALSGEVPVLRYRG